VFQLDKLTKEIGGPNDTKVLREQIDALRERINIGAKDASTSLNQQLQQVSDQDEESKNRLLKQQQDLKTIVLKFQNTVKSYVENSKLHIPKEAPPPPPEVNGYYDNNPPSYSEPQTNGVTFS
jgi:seryl-tRNA synthetase